MKNIELNNKGIGHEDYLFLSSIALPKIKWSFKMFKPDFKGLTDQNIMSFKITVFATFLIAILVFTIYHSTLNYTQNTVDAKTWTDVDLSSTQYEYNFDIE
jgi:ABC-type multidrug transport system permease subunit